MDRETKWRFLFDWLTTTGLSPDEVMLAITSYQKKEVKETKEESKQLEFESMG